MNTSMAGGDVGMWGGDELLQPLVSQPRPKSGQIRARREVSAILWEVTSTKYRDAVRTQSSSGRLEAVFECYPVHASLLA